MDLEKQYGFEVYPKRDVTIVRGDGALLWDADGKQYIDCASGVGVASVGHANDLVTQAIVAQSQSLITCPGIFYNDVRGQLMEKLVSITPDGLNRVFLCNSGTEAIEAAIKFARNTTGRNGIVSAMRGFHGRTLGALSATFKYRDEFEPLIPGHRFVPYNKLEKMEQVIDGETAAVVLEIVQGEGGVRPGDAEYFEGVRKLCDANDTILIIDEVQTGFGRTGKMFACKHYDLQPDIMCLAKAMAGGLPMGAVLCSEKVAPALGKHGSTFGGNPLACAASLATIEFIESEDLCQQAVSKGEVFRNRLEDAALDSVREIRQCGLMIGIELRTKSKPVIEKLVEKGILALPAGPTVVRLLPPLIISSEQIELAANAIIHAIQDCQ